MPLSRLKKKIKKIRDRLFRTPDRRANSLQIAIAAYQVITDQSPSAHLLASFQRAFAQGATVSQVLQPFKPEPPSTIIDDQEIWRILADRAYTAWPEPPFVQDPRLDLTHFQQFWQSLFKGELIIGQEDYLKVHQGRFWELFNAVEFVIGDRPARLLEFGNSEASALYPRLFEKLTLDLSDRPVADDYIGFTEAKCRQKFQIDQYFAIDLEHIDQADKLPEQGLYDCIIFTEVLEHLCADPQVVLQFLLTRLKPSGQLILSTPNYFRSENLLPITQGRNPQPYHPGFAENWDGHYHYREYSAYELDQLILAAGGTLNWGYYSSCWDHDHQRSRSLRGNLVVGISPKT
ncbi:class I SAM-dependent methyltransferase [Synechococcus elongatus]|uniref:class I SAM-dependent methyltransferase n=1 Tax=Synechococcus elongatus TaxID=32046 RepID=UPI000F7DBA10|nr:methyltransferase domain-containing protein [Synechococcus elongatus]